MSEPGRGPGEAEVNAARRRLAARRRDTERRVAALRRDLSSQLESPGTSDDEHDPEGATLAFERAQTQSLLDQARAELDDLDAAEQRLNDGTYGRCLHCGRPIARERLAARPAARTCIRCANRRR